MKKMRNNPTANHLRPFLYNHIKMDLDLVNASLKELGEMELKDDNLKEIAKLKEEICKKLLELDDYIDNIKVGGKSDVQSREE